MKKAIETRHITIRAGESRPEPIIISLSGSESHLEVSVGQGAWVTIFDTSSSALHSVTVMLEPESDVTYISLSTASARRFSSTVGAGASIHWHCTTLGPSEAHALVSTCIGANATSNIDWIFAVRGTEKQSVNVRNVFAARNGGGEITLKGVAQQKAYAVCNGMIEITEEGTGTDTYLTEDVLMLDPTAKIDAIPALEIRTNDVKASHSATVSRVTVEDLFYFQSRGIAPAVARAMYVDGFLSDLAESIPNPMIRDRILSVLAGAFE